MRRNIFTNASIAFVAILFTALVLEIALRALGETDADGRFTFLQFTLAPPDLPVNELRGQVEGYIANKDIAVVVYDEWLGWSFRPNSVRQGGTFTINSSGFRSRRDFSEAPPADTLRIAVFGDSFTAGDDVADDETWSRMLEQELAAAGMRAEVLNFGVGAYGMGQAYLRWQRLGMRFAPDIVIFGLQPENLKRNVNIFRQLLHRSGPAFSKPRFAIIDDELQLLNSPALPPEELIDIFDNFSEHPLSPYEFYYQNRFRAARWWSASRLASIIFEALRQQEEEPDIYTPGSEGGELGKAIIDAFAEDVAAEETDFVVLHLPLQSHLKRYFSNLPRPKPVYDFLLEHCRQSYNYVAFEEYLMPEIVDDAYWSATKHYGPPLHALLAEVLAGEIVDCIETGACRLTRFDDRSSFTVADKVADP